VVPGFYGTNSVKWLTRVTLAEARASGPFTQRWYNDPVRDECGSASGRTVPVWAIAPQSVIVAPAPDATINASKATEIWGWAWADGGVGQVGISVDGGSWQPALLEPGGRAGLAAFHAVLDAGEMRSRDARVARHCDEWGMPTCVRSAQRHLPRIRQSGLKLAGASFVLAGSEGPRSTDTAPNPVHRSFGRRFCRTDRTGPCGLAATPP